MFAYLISKAKLVTYKLERNRGAFGALEKSEGKVSLVIWVIGKSSENVAVLFISWEKENVFDLEQYCWSFSVALKYKRYIFMLLIWTIIFFALGFK